MLVALAGVVRLFPGGMARRSIGANTNKVNWLKDLGGLVLSNGAHQTDGAGQYQDMRDTNQAERMSRVVGAVTAFTIGCRAGMGFALGGVVRIIRPAAVV